MLGLFLLGGCSSTPVQTESVTSGPHLATLEEYTIEMDSGTARDVAFGPQKQRVTRQIIENELENLGYELTDNDDAEFKVIFATYTESSIDGSRVVRASNGTVVAVDEQGRRSQRRVITTQDDGPIVLGETSRLFLIDVVDTSSNTLLWRGYTRSDDVELTISAIQDEVEDILDAFPFAENELSFRLDEFDFAGSGGV